METTMTLSKIKAVISYWYRQMPWQWKAAFALLILLVSVAPLLMISAQERLKEARHAVLVGKSNLHDARKRSAGLLEAGSYDALQSFEASFPDQTVIPASIKKLLDIAGEQHLILKQADYKMIKGDTRGVIGYQIIMPVTGAYPNLMAFLFKVLSQVPNLALTNVSFGRKTIADGMVEANITMTLYIRHS
jgi:hypothetical protein